ncbi:hypothetical protein HYH03_011868 [Edaphochlamys debaryana]|uniref:Uncharacterized protein n=1 Tax=Edaphochlamys debaryana TaxID=47281 RepID=A0A835XR36_9CHLO|nr:hypothetical protein HYH03_011868 [Edaphochlamys debaryana]|eukprot:KAG2489587.1 hypothetical protein HYH03_011868 [Edaphochlamys debaryana]
MDAKQRKEAEQKLSYDGKRVVSAQQQRLSSMLRDMAEGRSDDHWNAAMKGTLIPHPGAESKTEAIDRERLARALSSAKK